MDCVSASGVLSTQLRIEVLPLAELLALSEICVPTCNGLFIHSSEVLRTNDQAQSKYFGKYSYHESPDVSHFHMLSVEVMPQIDCLDESNLRLPLAST